MGIFLLLLVVHLDEYQFCSKVYIPLGIGSYFSVLCPFNTETAKAKTEFSF